eukprot:11724573-Ditylum_brightwellii.AAC.1
MGDYGYGKAFPNHMEVIEKKCDLVQKMCLENEAKYDQLADKAKCILLSTHNNNALDVSPVKVLAAGPGTTNEVWYGFMYDAIKMLTLNDQVTCISIAFDSLSSKVMFTRNQFYDFIMGETDVVGVTDLNHVMKSYQSQ